MSIYFQMSTKQSLAFTSLTLGTSGPSGICLTETGAGKMRLEKTLFKVDQSHHNALNHCIILFVISTERLKIK